VQVAVLGLQQRQQQQQQHPSSGGAAQQQGRPINAPRRGAQEKQWQEMRDLACLLLEQPERMLSPTRFGNPQSWEHVVAKAEEEENEEVLRMVSELEAEQEAGLLEAFIATIDDMLSEAVPRDEADVLLTTTHKAKGLEFERVVVANDFHPLPNGGLSSATENGVSDRHLEEVTAVAAATCHMPAPEGS
jgi:superfamily I DNA/RNA helicase